MGQRGIMKKFNRSSCMQGFLNGSTKSRAGRNTNCRADTLASALNIVSDYRIKIMTGFLIWNNP
jgi:hypothetical protein